MLIKDRVRGSIEGCQFSSNKAGLRAGGIDVSLSSEMSIASCSFVGNNAPGRLGGGGLYVSSRASVSLSRCLFRLNSAPRGGGGAVRWESQATLRVLMACEPGRVLTKQDSMFHCLLRKDLDQDHAEYAIIDEPNTSAPLGQHAAWICNQGHSDAIAHANTARYGPCVATTFEELAYSGLPTRNAPGYAGETFQIKITKLDRYGQIISSDNTSSIQLRSSLAGLQAEDSAVSFFGSTFSVLQCGRAVLSIAIRPTFVHVDLNDQFTQLKKESFAYVEGADEEGGKMATSSFPLFISSGHLSVCPPGSVLVLETWNGLGYPGMCSKCEIGEYSSHPLSPPCKKCPKVS